MSRNCMLVLGVIEVSDDCFPLVDPNATAKQELHCYVLIVDGLLRRIAILHKEPADPAVLSKELGRVLQSVASAKQHSIRASANPLAFVHAPLDGGTRLEILTGSAFSDRCNDFLQQPIFAGLVFVSVAEIKGMG